MSEEQQKNSGIQAESEELDSSKFNRKGEWELAREYLSALGDLSELFSGCSRTLVHSYEQENGRISKLAVGKLQRLFGSPSMLAQLFFAARTYYPKEIESRKTVEPGDLLFFINLYELALFITVGYISRRISKQSDPESWKLICEPLQIYADLSVSLGATIPIIGPTRSLMVACGKFLGWGLLGLKKPEDFKKYRISNKTKNQGYDLAEELKFFGTTHLHIAALIWLRFGFGAKTSEEYLEGLINEDVQNITPGALKFKVAGIWLESLIERKTPPAQSLGEDYEIEEEQTDRLISTLLDLQQNGSAWSWLSRSRDCISPELTPELIVDYQALKKAAEIKGRRRKL